MAESVNTRWWSTVTGVPTLPASRTGLGDRDGVETHVTPQSHLEPDRTDLETEIEHQKETHPGGGAKEEKSAVVQIQT